MTARRTTTQRVHLVPVTPPHAPWWLPVLAGVIAVSVSLLLTVGAMTPDPFATTLIAAGIALIAGINTKILARALAPAARALTEADRADDRERDP